MPWGPPWQRACLIDKDEEIIPDGLGGRLDEMLYTIRREPCGGRVCLELDNSDLPASDIARSKSEAPVGATQRGFEFRLCRMDGPILDTGDPPPMIGTADAPITPSQSSWVLPGAAGWSCAPIPLVPVGHGQWYSTGSDLTAPAGAVAGGLGRRFEATRV